MNNRTIRSNGGSRVIKDAIFSLLATECILPGGEIYVFLPHLSTTPILDNAEQFADIFPLEASRAFTLQDILTTCAWKGSQIRIMTDLDILDSRNFVEELSKHVEYCHYKDISHPGFYTSHFALKGVINFSLYGIQLSSDLLRVIADPIELEEALQIARNEWEGAVK